MNALKKARLAANMTRTEAAEFLGYSPWEYRYIERHFAGGAVFCVYVMELAMRLWNKCYRDRYRFGGTFKHPR